jgi:hypothetical protein
VIISLFLVKKIQNSDQLMHDLSGTAILIELAKMLKKEPLLHFDVIFLWTGAERYGLWGMRNYCKKHFFDFYKEYELNRSFHISIDKFGNDMGLVKNLGIIRKKRINQKLNAILGATANRMNTTLLKLTLPKILPFHFKILQKYSEKFDKKIHFSCIFSFQKKKQLNSKEVCNKDPFKNNLENCINLCFNVVKSLDKRVEL